MHDNKQNTEHENLKKFKALAENSFDILTIIDSNGVILYESKATKPIFGYEPGERIGQNVFDFVHPDDLNIASEKFGELIKSSPETSVVIEFRFKDSNNNWIWVETSGRNFLHDPDINGIITNTRDITDSKLNKFQLQERNKELNAFYILSELNERKDLNIDEICQKFIDAFPESWQYPDKAYARLVVKNKEFCTDNFQNTKWKQSATVNVFGAEAGKIEVGYPEEISQKYESLFLEEEKRLLKAIAERIGKIIENRQAEEDIKIAKEKAENSEEELQKMYNDLQATEEELRAANEELVVTSDALKETNDNLLQAKEKAEKREKSISTILENIPHAVFAHDLDGNFVFVNNRSAKYTGYSKEDLLAMNVSDIDKNTISRNYRESIWKQLHETGYQQVLTEHTRKDGSVYPAEIHVSAISLDDKPVVLAIAQDITERKKAEEKLHRFRAALDNSADQIFIIDWDKMLFIDVNETACKDLNYSRSELLAMGPHDIKPYHSAETLKVEFDKIIRKKSRFGVIETVHRKKRGGDIPVEVRMKMLELKEKKLFVALARDITEQKKAFDKIKMNEKLKTLSTEVLSALNNPDNLTKTLSQIVSSVKDIMDFDAVGIRLNKNSDFPYFVQEGFSEEHLINENELIATDENGNIIKDKEGNNRLECTCGLVLSGYTNPQLPVFTKNGSFWTNDSTKLLELPTEEDPRLNPRNKCIFDGYNSMALIPIKADNKIMGLLHINNKDKGAFNLDFIKSFEEICSKIGLALMRNRVEEQLRLSEKKFRNIMASMNDIVFTLDKQHRHTGVYGPWVEKQGLTPKHFLGKTAREIFGAENAKLHEEANNKALKGEFVFYEWSVVTEKGTLHYQTSLSPIFNETNEVEGLVGIGRDISKLKKAEEAVIKAKQQAEAANEAKSEFLANMSHEIRTPLYGVIGFNELLLQDAELTHTQENYVKKSHVSAKLLMDLINDILDFSLIEAGKLELEELKTDIIELVQNVTNVIEYKAEEKNLDIKLNIDDNIPRFAFIDPLRLRQVLVNLLGNAVKFTEKGEVELSINFTKNNEKDKKGKFHFSVRDTGIGISEENQKKLFKAFSQADTSTKRKYGGTGLGLIISYKIVEKMGSELQLESKPGKGTTFYFTVEKHYEYGKPAEADKKEEKQKRKIAETAPVVLVVEDTDIVMYLVKSLLKQIIPETSIVEATDGVEGINKYKETNPDIVLLDIQMPTKDGYSVAREIRQFEKENKLPRKPVIALTARAVKGEKEKCLQAGMDDFLTKPLENEQLAEALDKHLSKNIKQISKTDVHKKDKQSSIQSEEHDEKQTKHFDKKQLLERMGGNEEDAEELIQLALSQIPGYIDNIKNAIEENNFNKTKKAAHKLKGATRFVSFNHLSNLAEKIEYNEVKDIGVVKGILGEIEGEFEEVKRVAGC